MKFWSKRIKNVGTVAKELGEDKDKVKALKDGNLEIGGKTMERVLSTLEEDKIKGAIRKNDIWKWIQESDFKKLREDFGYSAQTAVARLIPCDPSIICNLENHKERFKEVSPKLIAIYEFYNNDFNKNIKKKDYNIKPLKNEVKDVVVKSNKNKNKDKETKAIWEWYKKTDIRALRMSLGYRSLYDIVKFIKVSQSCLSDLELKHFKKVNKTIRNAYYFYKNGEEATGVDLDNIFNWYKSVEDFPTYRREFGYSLNKFMSALNLSYDQTRTFERHAYKSATPVVERIYNFYHNESNRRPKIVWEPNENNTYVDNKKEEKVEEVTNTDFKSRLERNIIEERYENAKVEEIGISAETIIKALEDKVKALERQVYLYEKLISKL